LVVIQGEGVGVRGRAVVHPGSAWVGLGRRGVYNGGWSGARGASGAARASPCPARP
jgi:hypothetical protein